MIKQRRWIFLIAPGLMLAAYLYLFQCLLRGMANNQPHLFFIGVIAGALIALGPLVLAELMRHNYRAQGLRTADLAHELRSPLSIMINSLEMIGRLTRNTAASDPAARGTYVQMFQNNTQRLKQFIANLKKVVSINDGSIGLRLAPFSFSELVTSTAQMFAPLAEAKGLTFVVDVSPVAPFVGDQEKIAEVVSNLISNAIKYSSTGRILITVRESTRSVRCCVEDQGRGLKSNDLKRIFNRFYQVETGTGSGLGLAIAKGWVEAHGGKMKVNSDGPNAGSRFWFELPVKS